MTRSTSQPTPIFPLYLLPSLPFRRRHRPALGSSPPSSTSTSSSSSSPVFASSSTSSSTSSQPYLSGHTSLLRCARCSADLALGSQIISKGFTGRHGRAYLVSAFAPRTCSSPGRPKPSWPHDRPRVSHSQLSQQQQHPTPPPPAEHLPNTSTHPPVIRQLVTGQHTVSDLICACGAILGWKYDAAEEDSQRYKVGKFILETKKVRAESCWEEEGGEGRDAGWDGDDAGRDDGAGWDAGDAGDAGDGAGDGDDGDDGERGIREVGGEERVEFDSHDEDECEDLFAGVWSAALAGRRRRIRNRNKGGGKGFGGGRV